MYAAIAKPYDMLKNETGRREEKKTADRKDSLELSKFDQKNFPLK